MDESHQGDRDQARVNRGWTIRRLHAHTVFGSKFPHTFDLGEIAMIDMHAHWRPAELADALRARTREPRIVRNDDGVEVHEDARSAKSRSPRRSTTSDAYLERMDRQGVSMSVLSLLGTFCWIESQPLEVSAAAVPDGQRQPLEDLPGAPRAASSRTPRCRWSTLPPPPRSSSARWRCRASSARSFPANGFLTAKHAEKMRPLLEVANRHRAVLFIHHGPLPGDAFPKVARRHRQRAPPQRHARHAGEPVLGDGDAVPHRLPRAVPRCDDLHPQPRRQHSVRSRAHGPPLPARHAEGRAAVGALPPREGATSTATRSARARSRPR